jgi:hypothetical protein
VRFTQDELRAEAAHAVEPPQDGIRYDAESESYVARHTILTAGRTEEEAKNALASAVRLLAQTWPRKNTVADLLRKIDESRSPDGDGPSRAARGASGVASSNSRLEPSGISTIAGSEPADSHTNSVELEEFQTGLVSKHSNRELGPVFVAALPTLLEKAQAVLASMNEWLGNDDGLMIDDIVEWRDQLASGVGIGPSEEKTK